MIIYIYIIMKLKALLNKSTNRISHKISCFSKIFFDELYEKFELNEEFWDNDLLDLYINDYKTFAKNISEEYNYPEDKICNNIPVIIVNEWRFNYKLIDYIIKRSNVKNYDKEYYYRPVDDDVNGFNDKFVIRNIDYDDYEDHEIICESDGSERLQSVVNKDSIIEDLIEMIEKKYRHDDIEFYFRLNNTYKYTKELFRYHEWREGEWHKDDDYDLTPDSY